MKFKAKPYRLGGSWVVTIPSDFIEQGYINPEKEQDIDMKERKEEGA